MSRSLFSAFAIAIFGFACNAFFIRLISGIAFLVDFGFFCRSVIICFLDGFITNSADSISSFLKHDFFFFAFIMTGQCRDDSNSGRS